MKHNYLQASAKYFWIAKITMRSNLAYFGEIGSRFIFLAIILYIFMCLWRVTYTDTGATYLGDFTFAQMLWYLAITESIILSTPDVSQKVDEDVRKGTLSIHLIKPLSYPLYFLSMTFGERIVRFTMNMCVGACVVYFFVGPIGLSLKGILLFSLAIPLAFILDFLTYFTIGLAAFWLEDTRGLRIIYSRIVMVLGGMLIPIELFPDFVQPIIKVLPFSQIVYGPAKLFVNPSSQFLFTLLLQQFIWVCLLTLFMQYIYKLALERVHANGG
jgi:ABC-2 type transport system permease protein